MTTLADALNQYNARMTQREPALRQVEEFLEQLQHPLLEYTIGENDTESCGHLRWRDGHTEGGWNNLLTISIQKALPARRSQAGVESYLSINVPAELERRFMLLFRTGGGHVGWEDWNLEEAVRHVAAQVGDRLRREAIAARNQEHNARTPIASTDLEAALARQRGFDL